MPGLSRSAVTPLTSTKMPLWSPSAKRSFVPQVTSAAKEIPMAPVLTDKRADLAGPGIGNYTELEQILPTNYHSLLTPKQTQRAIFELKNFIEKNQNHKHNLMMV